jgi:hypothetical protein
MPHDGVNMLDRSDHTAVLMGEPIPGDGGTPFARLQVGFPLIARDTFKHRRTSMLRTCGHVLCLTLCVAGLSRGQVVTSEAPAPAGTESRRVSQILGSTVQLNNATGYGKVDDIVIGPDNQIEYLVVSHDDQYVALPWTAGRFNPGQRVVVYSVAPAAILPLHFRSNAWPNFIDPGYTRRVETIFPGLTRREMRRMERRGLQPVPPPGTVVVPQR